MKSVMTISNYLLRTVDNPPDYRAIWTNRLGWALTILLFSGLGYLGVCYFAGVWK